MLKVWKILHPRVTMEHLGLIPHWFRVGDDRPAKEIIEANYPYGKFGFEGFELRPDNSIKYPGDPAYKPLATLEHGDELVAFYDSAWVAVIQKDRSFAVIRCD